MRLWFPCALALALAACGKPDVRGTVLPAAQERAAVTFTRVDVRLLHGRLIEKLSQLADQRRSEALSKAREQTRSLLAAKQRTLTDRLLQERAALAPIQGSPAEEDTASPRGCLPVAEAQLEETRLDYEDLLKSIAPSITALGVAADSPQQALPVLRDSVQKKMAVERRRLRDEHLQSQLAQQTRTVLAPGRGMDRVCWKAENKLDVGLRFRGAIVLLNGKPLPDSVARQIWGLPRVDDSLDIPNDRAADRDVLLPGRKFESCFYARGVRLPRDVAETYRLTPTSPTRGGEWQVQWRDISLVGTRAENASSPEELAGTVLARQLEEFRAGLEETQLIDAITSSTAAGAVTRAEAGLLACHRAIESAEALREVERGIGALEAGRTDDPIVQATLRPVLRQDLGEPTNLADWTKKALAVVDSSTAVRKMSELGKPFELTSITRGNYTLLGESKPLGGNGKLWILPLQVNRSVQRDLEIPTARNGSLEKLLQDVLLRPQSLPADS